MPGVARVTADIQGNGVVVGRDGTPVRNGGAPSFVFPYRSDDPALHLVQGRAPAGPGEVVLESDTLRLSKLSVGDRTRALLGGQPTDVTVVGEASFDVGLAGATIVAVDEATAVTLFAPDGKVPSFSLRAAPASTRPRCARTWRGCCPRAPRPCRPRRSARSPSRVSATRWASSTSS